MLDSNILNQVKAVFENLDAAFELKVVCDRSSDSAKEMKVFVDDFVSTSDKLTASYTETDDERLEFTLLKDGKETGIKFRGIPNGHEFTSLLLAILNADGKGKNLPDDAITRRIASLKGGIRLQTYVSLTCTNCPDVVQALNVMSLINPNISNETIDGALFQQEVSAKNIQGVPSVFLNGEQFHVGRGELGELLQKLEDKMGSETDDNAEETERKYDVVVLGGGPAGSSAAIYSARKGLRVAVVAERIGGQVKDTVGIENLISVTKTTGTKLADDLRNHIQDYPIDVFENRNITDADIKDNLKRIKVRGGETFIAPALIVATGASWRRLNVDGETEYMGHGVHFCPHCDGPFYKDKDVAVIGGGNSGIEAAIDLAGICRKVTVLEFADTLRADTVLQEKAAKTHNIEIFTSSQTMQVKGNGNTVTAIRVKDRNTDEERDINLDGIFVQIGLSPNTEIFKDKLNFTHGREIQIDASCRTSVKGVYAAGDASNVPFKQIVIAMGEGAKAALSAFDDRVRGII